MTRTLLLVIVTALLAGCGSGGGANVSAVDPGPEPGTAIIDMSTYTDPASAVKVIYGVEFVLHLPKGVTLATDPVSGEVQGGVLVAIDSGATAGARYVPATGTTPAFVRVNVADPLGFMVGHLATMTCDFSARTEIGAAGFLLDGFLAKDIHGAEIPGVTPHFAVRKQ